MNGEAEAAELESEIAEVCGLLNATVGRLVSLIARVLATGAWAGAEIRSPEHWISWKCGVSLARARTLLAMARRLGELPETRTALEAGELSEDQAAVVCRKAPPHIDAQVAELAKHATVSQLRHALNKYAFAVPRQPDSPPREETRRLSFGYDDEGLWRLTALLPADEGAHWEQALAAARDDDDDPESTWPDAFLAVARRSLAGPDARRPGDHHLVLLHVDAERDGDTAGHLHLGPGVPEGLRQYLTCDSRVRPVFERQGLPVSVGRSFRTVPDRTRIVVEDRDGGCRAPGCHRTRWLHVHHIRHWDNGGATDTPNLLALCSRHHRLHHLGHLGIRGNADEPDGVEFTDRWGRVLDPSGYPRSPFLPPPKPTGTWSHPTGERFHYRWLHFDERAAR